LRGSQTGLHGPDRLIRLGAETGGSRLTQSRQRQRKAAPDLAGIGRDRRTVHAVEFEQCCFQQGTAVVRFDRHGGYFFAPSG
jgi:hypothetical protein